jgi:hypothetical protein
MRKLFAGLFLFSLSLIPIEASASVQFRAATTQLYAKVNEGYSVDLTALLADVGSGNLTWSVGPGMPNWMALDRSQLYGTPRQMDFGTFHFRLFVSDGPEGAETDILLHVDQTVGPLDLGIQRVGQTFLYDLKRNFDYPNPMSLSYSSDNLPPWLDLSSLGDLSGVPTNNDVGAYEFTLLVTDPYGNASQFSVTGVVSDTLVNPPRA